jgi:hypothetical protein
VASLCKKMVGLCRRPSAAAINIVVVVTCVTVANAVELPYLTLLDNLGEPTNLGFCIDLKGWPGRMTDAQLHSCKPTGGPAGGGSDQQFVPNGGAIAGRADAAGHCLQPRRAVAGSRVDVPKCDKSEPLQRLQMKANGQIHLQGQAGLCLVGSARLRQASCGGTCGSFVARNLRLQSCASTPVMLKTWRVVTKPSEVAPTVNSKPPPSSSSSGGQGGSNSHHRGSPGTETGRECYDGVDNDNDSLTDCMDPDCLTDRRVKQRCEMMHGGGGTEDGDANGGH